MTAIYFFKAVGTISKLFPKNLRRDLMFSSSGGKNSTHCVNDNVGSAFFIKLVWNNQKFFWAIHWMLKICLFAYQKINILKYCKLISSEVISNVF